MQRISGKCCILSSLLVRSSLSVFRTMAAGKVAKEEHGVVKLVHPGGFSEEHKNPKTAAAVMEKNPRHCVTRPDVFRYPWIVVRPEAVLNLGSLFHCSIRYNSSVV